MKQRIKKMTIVGILICLLISILLSKYVLTVSYYSLELDQVTELIRILQISDLHNAIFGKNNQYLIDVIEKHQPDLILMSGDMINEDEQNLDVIVALIEQLSSSYPVYYSLGNHEVSYIQNEDDHLIEELEKAGAHVLDFAYEDITINQQSLRIGGIYGYCLAEKYLETNEASIDECNFLTEFQTTENLTLLMSHLPIAWMINDGLDQWDVDVVVSGHLHGGVINIPFIGGIYGPDLVWFCGKVKGLFTSSDNKRYLIVSSGLGSHGLLPRVNNQPEIVIIDLK